MRSGWLLPLLLLSQFAWADGSDWSGHLKYRLLGNSYPQNSIFRQQSGGDAVDHTLSLRLNIDWESGKWQTAASYLLDGFYGDSFSSANHGGLVLIDDGSADARRLFDLSQSLSRQGMRGARHKLDRLTIEYRGERDVWKIGRQASAG